MRANTQYCIACCQQRPTVVTAEGIRCADCERLLVPAQKRRPARAVNASRELVAQWANGARWIASVAQPAPPRSTRDYLLTPNGGRFQIQPGSIADRLLAEKEIL